MAIILTAEEAETVRGISPVDGFAHHAIEPRPLANGDLALPESILTSTAHGDVVDFLATLPTNASPTYANAAEVAGFAYPSWKTAGVRAPLAPDTLVFTPANTRNSVLVNAAAGTVIGTFSAENGAVVQSVEILSILGQRNGYFPGGNLDTRELPDVFAGSGKRLVVGTAPIDFEGAKTQNGAGPPLGIPHYNVSCRVHFYSGNTEDMVVEVRPQFAEIEPTGDETNNVTEITGTDFATLRAALQSDTPSRTINITATGLVGEVNIANTETIVDCDNLTVNGNRQAIVLKDYGPRIKGTNQIWRDLAFRVGDDVWGRAISARDSCDIDGGPCDTVIFENCDFTWGIDENFGMTGVSGQIRPRRILFYRCLFAEPLWDAGHSEGIHPFGCLAVDFAMQVDFVKCMYIGHKKRSPEFGCGRGLLVQNNVIAGYGNEGAFNVSSPHAVSERGNLGITAIWRNNLLMPSVAIGQGATENQLKSRAWKLARVGANSWLYQSGNHFFANDAGVLDFTADALSFASHTLLDDSLNTCFATELPFIPADYDLMPTSTEEEREALYDDVVDNVGVRTRTDGVIDSGDLAMSEIGHRIITDWRAGTINQPDTPADVGGYVTGVPE